MPGFGLAHKPSKSKLRHSTVPDPSTSENHARTMTHPQPPMSPAPSPSPIDPSGSGFKLFSWKKRSVSTGATSGSTSPGAGEPRPYYPSEPPRPILKSAVSDQGPGGSIRFAKSAGGVWDAPDSPKENVQPRRPSFTGDAHGMGGGGQPLFNRPPPQLQMQIHQANLQRHSTAYDGLGSPTRSVSVNRGPSSPRRSSRPASPSITSFGARIRTESAPASVGASSSAMQAITRDHAPVRRGSSPTSPSLPDPSVLCSPPPTAPMHVTTPPTTYYPPMQSRAPPPSPFRPTTTLERRRSSLRTLPGRLPLAKDMAPTRMSSLIASAPVQTPPQASAAGDRSSIITLPGVPMLNIIPATPQANSEEFSGARYSAKREPEELGQGIELDWEGNRGEQTEGQMEEIHADSLPRSSSAPAIELTLDFSPFSPNVDLPLEDSDDEEDRQDEAAEDSDHSSSHSPPFVSYPSLPSLSSQQSMPSGQSLSTSSSVSSIMSFPDVEEALGSMLASLSDGNLPSMDSSSSMNATHYSKPVKSMNPGLGLGLDLPDPVSITAPLSPRKTRPPPIDTAIARALPFKTSPHVPQSAPPVINHRVAFYGTAKAHPRSPTSGTFHHSLDDIAFHTSEGRSPNAISSTKSIGSTPSSSSLSSSSRDSTSTIGLGLVGCRDSMSLNSECSDDDLHTASIINLTPLVGRAFGEVRGEEIIAEEEYVGMAL